MIEYVLGFAFDEYHETVALVKKRKGPPVNIGKWNGIGGKVESGEMPLRAMVREWSEEVGSNHEGWTFFGNFRGPDFVIYLYKTTTKSCLPDTNDVDEELEFHVVEEVTAFDTSSYAQCVPAMVAHALSENGELEISIGLQRAKGE